LIWVLKGLRAGDTAQAMELALRLGGRVETKQMTFNMTHVVPNYMLGARVSHLTPDAKQVLRPPWPDVVVATGRRTAPVAVWIKKQSHGKTKLLQIGRPRMALSGFDVVVTTPQYGLPAAPNVVTLAMPFANPKAVAPDALLHFETVWKDLPRPWLLAVVGGQKFPLRLDKAALTHFGQALQRRADIIGGSVILLDSPRSPPGALEGIANELRVPHWQYKRGEGPNPYQAALQLCDELAVTSDSVSMTTEMLLTGKPAWIFRLAVSPLALQWSAQRGIAAFTAQQGIFTPPRNVDGFMQNLLDAKLVGDLISGEGPTPVTQRNSQHENAIQRIKTILQIETGSSD
jgi:uncharacterized protein